MALTCPNKNSQEWKDLVSAVGEVNAMLAFVKNNESIPSVEEANLILTNTTRTNRNESKLFSLTNTDVNFSIQSIDKITRFLDTINVPVELVNEIKSSDGTILDKALAVADFMDMTVKVIDDLEKRPKAWNSLPEEAVHFWFRLLKENTKLKKDIYKGVEAFKEHAVSSKANPLLNKQYIEMKQLYDSIYNNEDAFNEELISRLITDKIAEISEGTGDNIFKFFWHTFINFIREILGLYSNTEHNPFYIAAERILTSDLKDLMSVEDYQNLHGIVNNRVISTKENSINELELSGEYLNYLFNTKFKRQSRYLSKTIDSLVERSEAASNFFNSMEEVPLKKTVLSEEEISALKKFNKYKYVEIDLKSYDIIAVKFRKQSIALNQELKLDGIKKEELNLLNYIRTLIKQENPSLKSITALEFINEVKTWIDANVKVGLALENDYRGYRLTETFKHESTGHNKISIRFNDEYFKTRSHFPYSPTAWGNLTPYKEDSSDEQNTLLMHEIQNDFWEDLSSITSYVKSSEKDKSAKRKVTNEDIINTIYTYLVKKRSFGFLNNRIINNNSLRSYIVNPNRNFDTEVQQIYFATLRENVIFSVAITIKEAITEQLNLRGISASDKKSNVFKKINDLIYQQEQNIEKNYNTLSLLNSFSYNFVSYMKKLNENEEIKQEIERRISIIYNDKNHIKSTEEGRIQRSYLYHRIAVSILNLVITDEYLSRFPKDTNKVFITDLTRTAIVKVLSSKIQYNKKAISTTLFNSLYNGAFFNALNVVSKKEALVVKKNIHSSYLNIKLLKSLAKYSSLSNIEINKMAKNIVDNITDLYDTVFKKIDEKQNENITDKIIEIEKSINSITGTVDDFNVFLDKNYAIPLIHSLLQSAYKGIKEGRIKRLIFSGHEITLLTQGSRQTAELYAGPDEVALGIATKVGPMFITVSKIPGIKLIYEKSLPGYTESVGGYVVDFSNYKYESPLLFSLSQEENKSELSKLEDTVFQEANMILNTSNPNEVKYVFKSIQSILNNKQKIDQWNKHIKDVNLLLDKIQKDLGISKDQIDLIKQSEGNTLDEKLINFIADYSYSVEINTSTVGKNIDYTNLPKEFDYAAKHYFIGEDGFAYARRQTGEVVAIPIDFFEDEQERWAMHNKTSGEQRNTEYYSNLTVPGGTNYTENEISTPLITPSIKGHAQFSTDRGIGWFRSDEKAETYYDSNIRQYLQKPVEIGSNKIETSKTRRVLEIQSDLFQKGRDKKYLTGNIVTGPIQVTSEQFLNKIKQEVSRLENQSELPFETFDRVTVDGREYERLPDGKWYRRVSDEYTGDIGKNQFLQLLNKDNNWVTFFIKSIVQDSAKKGYEKVLFPNGETAAKVEGHETIADEIKRIDDDIKILDLFTNEETQEEALKQSYVEGVKGYYIKGINTTLGYDLNHGDKKAFISIIKQAILDLNKKKQELKSQGIEKLKPIEAFYEIKVGNILKKNYNVKEVTDEYGNTWREVDLSEHKEENIVFQEDLTNLTLKEFLTLQITKLQNGEITKKQYVDSIKSKYGTPELTVEQGLRKYERLREAFPLEIKISFDAELDRRAAYDRENRTIMLNPLLLSSEAIGHEFGHILIDLLGGMSNPLVAKVRRLMDSQEVTQRIIDHYTPLYKNPEDVQLEVVAYAIGKQSIINFKIEEENRIFHRLILRIFQFFQSVFNLRKRTVQELTNMMFSGKLLNSDLELRKTDNTLSENTAREVEFSWFENRRKAYKEPKDPVKEIINNSTDVSNSNLSTLREKAIEVIERKIGIYKSKAQEAPIKQAESFLRDIKRAESPEEALYQFVRLADLNTDHIYEQLTVGMANKDLTIKKLEYWKDYIMGFGLIEDIFAVAHKEYKRLDDLNKVPLGENVFSRESIEIMQKVTSRKNEILKAYREEGSNLLAEFLAPYYNQVEIEYRDFYEREWNRLPKEEKDAISVDDYIDKQIEANKESLKKANFKKLQTELLEASRDYSTLTRYLDTIIDSEDAVVSAMVQVFTTQEAKTIWESRDVRYEMTDLVKGLENMYGKGGTFTTDPQKMYDFMLEKRNGKYTGYILHEVYGGFQEEYRSVIKKIRNSNLSEGEKEARIKAWFKENRTLRSDAYYIDLYKYIDSLWQEGSRRVTKEELEAYKRKLEYERYKSSYDTFYDEKTTNDFEKDVTQIIQDITVVEEIKAWMNINKPKYYVYADKWINKDFAKFKKILENKDDPRTKFYNYVVKKSEELQRYIPYGKQIPWRIPAVLKDYSEYIGKGEVRKAVKEKVRRNLGVTREDELLRGEPQEKRILVNEQGDPQYFMPVYYTYPITDENGELSSDISLDLGGSFEAFFTSMIDFKNKKEILPQMEMAKHFVTIRAYVEIDSNGKPYIDALDPEKKRKSYKNQNKIRLAEQLNDWFESVFYGRRQLDEGSWKFFGISIDKAKLIDLLNSYTSINLLGLNFVQGTANTLLGHANDWIEAFGGQHYSPKNFSKAEYYYTTHFGTTIKDIGQRKPTGIVNLLNDEFDTLHEYNNGKMKDNNLFKSLIKMDSVFFTTKMGEHAIQSKVMLAMLDKIPAYNTKGESMGSILDVYTTKNGKLVFKDGFDIERSKWTEKDRKDFMFSMQRILADMHGDYYRNAVPAWQRQSLTRMAGLFRKFVVPGFKRRWDTRHADGLRGAMVEGYYRTFLRTLFQDLIRLKFNLMSEDWKLMTRTEKANIRKFIAEMSFLMGATLLVTLFTKLDGDDDDSEEEWIIDFANYQSYRFIAEMSFFFNPSQTLNILRSPAASITLIENAIQFTGQLLDFANGSVMERFDSGSWEGHLKIEKYATNLFLPGYKQWYRLKYIEDTVKWFK